MSKEKALNSYVREIKKTFSKKTKSDIWNNEHRGLTEHEKPVDIRNYYSSELTGSKCLEQESDRHLHQEIGDRESGSDLNSNHLDISKLTSPLHRQGDSEERFTLADVHARQVLSNGTRMSDTYYGARPKTLASKFLRQTITENSKGAKTLNVIEEKIKDDVENDEETLALCENDKTSDYDTMRRDDVSSDESSDDECHANFATTRLISNSVPDFTSNRKYEDKMKDLKPLRKNYFVNVKDSENIQIIPDKGTATINTTTVTSSLNTRHLGILDSVRNTNPQIETELFKGGQKYLERPNHLPMVIFKGSGYGCTFAAKMLFERVVSAGNRDTKTYYLKSPDEMSHIGHNEKAVILVVDLNGPTGTDTRRLDGWYEILKERMATGTCTRGNLTFIMTLQDSDTQHRLLQTYSEYVIDAAKKQFRPSSATKEKLVDAFMRQKNLRASPVKGGSPIPVYKDGTLKLIDKDIVDGIVPLLGSVRCIGKLAEFFRSDLSEGLNTLRKPIPDVVRRIRKSFKEGGPLFLSLLAVHAHGGQLGVGRVNQMRKLNEETKKFWYSTDNIDKTSKTETKKMEKLFGSLELQHLYRFARENNHLLDLGNRLQTYVKRLDGEFLSENNNVYRFCDGRVYYSFLIVYCEMYPDALEHCEDEFFFNFVQSSRNTFEDDEDVLLKVDDRNLNVKTRAVMKRFKKEMMLRHVAKCMKHPIMSTSFFQLFLKYLGESKHLLWKVLTQQDSDPKEPYSCLYHGMTVEQDTFKGVPRNITEVIILHDIWKNKRRKQKWKKWTRSQESESLIHAAELSNCQTFILIVEKGANIPFTALKKALDVGAEEIIEFISNNGSFNQHEWHKAAQYAAKTVSCEILSEKLFQVLISLVMKTDVNKGVEDIPPLIHHAVQINDVTLLRKLVDGDIGITAVEINKVYKGETPLTVATRLGFRNIVEILLAKHARPSQNEVFVASTEGYDEVLKLLLHKNPSLLFAEDSKGLIPIFYAVSNGHCETVMTLLSVEEVIRNSSTPETPLADVWQPQMVVNAEKTSLLSGIRQCQKTNHERQTALHVAAEKGHERILSVLLSHGFDVNVRDCNNETPLSLACKGRHTNSLRIILNAWNLKGYAQDEQIVLRVVQNSDTELLELFVEYGFGINFVNRQFGVPLHVAIQYGMHEMARFLLLKGADPEKAQDGYRPLHIAAAKGDIVSLKMLKEFGANLLSVTGEKRESIIHLATDKRQALFIKTVFQMSDCLALTDMKTTDGETALHVASKKGCPILTELLLQIGFNAKLPSKSGFIPVSLAEQGLQMSIKSKNIKKWNAFADCVKILQNCTGKQYE